MSWYQSGTGGLRAAIAWRLLFVAVGLTLLFVGLGGWFHGETIEHEITRVEQMTRARYVRELEELDAHWLEAARRLVQRIEFARLLEQPGERRWAQLAIFLAAQGDLDDIANLFVLSPAGRLLFAQGADTHGLVSSGALGRLTLQVTPGESGLRAGWVFLHERTDWHRVIRLPIWLGADGSGELLLTRPLTSSLLDRLSMGDTRLFVLRPEARPLSATPGDLPLIDPMSAQTRHEIAGHVVIQLRLPWPGKEANDPELIVERDIRHIAGLDRFAFLSLTALAATLLGGWLVLGRWLGRLGQDLSTLREAAESFSAEGKAEPARQRLKHASERNDAVGVAAEALAELMTIAETRATEQRGFVETLALLDEAVFELDRDNHITSASAGWVRLLQDNRQVIGQPLTDFFHGDDRESLAASLHALATGEKTHASLRLRLVHDVGAWIELRLARDDAGIVRGALRDITQIHRHEKQITFMALHDALTGLPNRVLLEERIGSALRDARREKRKVAVGFIDLDNFKLINDNFGHEVGDRLLIAFARRITSLLRGNDTLARWGGDEFVLLLPNVQGEDGAREVAERLLAALHEPFVIEVGRNHESFSATASIGYALFPDDSDTAESLLSRADRAMFLAKSRGRFQTCSYADLRHRDDDRRTVYLQNRLVQAIERERVEVWFQPIVTTDGRLVMAETLARWHDESSGEWISPAVFIPIAENSGHIGELGRRIWKHAIAALAKWKASGHVLRLAINLSKRQLVAASFFGELLADLKAAGLAPADLVLEITESVALSEPLMQERLQQLRAAGFVLALDDFGTNYSSLSQLHSMPLGELKIDKSFVQRIGSVEGRAMVETIVAIARTLGLKTIAEGVEDAETAALLATVGVDFLQGYHFAHPLPAEKFEKDWLATQREAPKNELEYPAEHAA